MNSKLMLILGTLLVSFGLKAEGVDLETFETLSNNIKSKQNVSLQDESALKVLPQYNQPQRKIQATIESSESSLSTE